jgi:hypothetical protein
MHDATERQQRLPCSQLHQVRAAPIQVLTHPASSCCCCCSEDYNWWWRSYFTSGSSALYLFAYSAFYFYSKLDISKLLPLVGAQHMQPR